MTSIYSPSTLPKTSFIRCHHHHKRRYILFHKYRNLETDFNQLLMFFLLLLFGFIDRSHLYQMAPMVPELETPTPQSSSDPKSCSIFCSVFFNLKKHAFGLE